ncbi:MAG: hypothetical protein WCF33_17975 [Pseudonocardiaceae bacterium]
MATPSCTLPPASSGITNVMAVAWLWSSRDAFGGWAAEVVRRAAEERRGDG